MREGDSLFESLSHLSLGLPPVPLPLPLQSSSADPESMHMKIHILHAAQNGQDRVHDGAGLRQLMRATLSRMHCRRQAGHRGECGAASAPVSPERGPVCRIQ